MSELEADLKAVRIRHFGQCPEPKGHAMEGAAFCFGVFIASCIWFLVLIATVSYWRDYAIVKGLGTYSPNGVLVWK